LTRTPASSPESECAGCRQQRHAGSKTLHQQNPPVLNWRCRLTHDDVYSGRRTAVGWLRQQWRAVWCDFSGMPDEVGLEAVAQRFKKFNIHGLLIVGGFDVSFTACRLTAVMALNSP